MAPWQFRTEVLPMIATGGLLEGETEDWDGGKRYWNHYPAMSAVEEALSQLLPEVASWSTSARMFGDSKGDQIELWKEQGHLTRVAVAFSLAHPNLEFITRTVETVSRVSCVFRSVQLKEVFAPDLKEFVGVARRCSAARYIPSGKPLSGLLE